MIPIEIGARENMQAKHTVDHVEGNSGFDIIMFVSCSWMDVHCICNYWSLELEGEGQGGLG